MQRGFRAGIRGPTDLHQESLQRMRVCSVGSVWPPGNGAGGKDQAQVGHLSGAKSDASSCPQACAAHPSAAAQVHPHHVLLALQPRSACCQHWPPAPQEVGPELVICRSNSVLELFRATAPLAAGQLAYLKQPCRHSRQQHLQADACGP